MKLRKLTAAEVEFEESTEPEDIPVEGNFSTYGSEEDKRYEQELLDRLNRGDGSAWCILVVKARWKGFTGYASLGGYVFPAGNSGTQNAEYAKEEYAQLRAEALDDLNVGVQSSFDAVCELILPSFGECLNKYRRKP